MTKDKYPELQAALEKAVDTLDLNGVLYRLAEIAVKKRDAADYRVRLQGWILAPHSLVRLSDGP